MLLASCSTYGGTSAASVPSFTCGDVLATVVQRERTGDTAGAINAEVEWLSSNCSTEYNILIDYVSTKGMPGSSSSDSCEIYAQFAGEEAIALLAEDGVCVAGAGATLPDVPPAETQPGGGIAWNEAVSYAGTNQRVCGPIVGNGNSNDDVFLNLGLDYPDPGRFQIVIWDVGALEPITYGSTLCASGQITLYNGVAQIELRDPSQIDIYG